VSGGKVSGVGDRDATRPASESAADRAGVEILAELESVLRSRRDDPPAGSYSATLLSDPERASRKIMEEAFEVCLELGRPNPDPERVASESADLIFHLCTGLVGAGVPLDDVWGQLGARRRGEGS
jgi:phosphoribosyl-ATP pyrophosphohydrolase